MHSSKATAEADAKRSNLPKCCLQTLKAKEDVAGRAGGQRHRERVIAPSALTTSYVVLP